jgi:V/A-type H+/Na+-transporting ATPase subunit D
MARLPLNKSSLKQERNRLTIYARFLPSLDLKRRQLMWELRRAERELAEIEVDISRLVESAQDVFALVGSVDMKLTGLVRVRRVDLSEENVVGVRLPRMAAVDVQVAEYSTLAKPFWLDALVDKLRSMLELRARRGVGGERVRRLEQAVRKVTQRVNLFEKVLIPQARENISRIQIHLADAERAAVVRSKIMKANRQQRTVVA